MTSKKTRFGIRFIYAGILAGCIGSANAFDYLQPLPKSPIIPKDNPLTESKIALGKQLYFDPRLSRDGDLSCNSCHNLAAGGDDDGAVEELSKGKLNRSAPTIWNVAHLSVAYWDSRSTSLEDQGIEHLLDPNTMNMGTAQQLEGRLKAIPGYKEEFAKAFKDKQVSIENVSKALASFERTLNTPNSAFDRYINGDKNAISKQAKRGLTLFNDVGCLSCHFGVNFAGPAPGPALKMGDGFYELFPNHLGSHDEEKYRLADDLGLFQVTMNPADKHLFRVPPMRNIELTAPYFHNGSVATLEEAVRIMALVQLKVDLTPQQISDIVAFLKTLTGEIPELNLPRLPETPGTSLTAN